jgi:hypothetical protein
MNLLRRESEAPMRNDLRNHDAFPTEEESAWVGADVVGLIVRAMALAGLALALGAGVSMLVDPGLAAPPAVAPAPR